ncbi:MAG: hypothetical protein KJZ59_03170, partial [Pararhodobacter sp.]|nr:hypothetical protein [Pararhodobacter sp.]
AVVGLGPAPANALDTLRIAALAGQGGVIEGVREALRATPLRRGPSDIYRLHRAFVSGMGQAEAGRLLALESRLSRAAAKGENVVSHVHPGR